MNLIDDMSCALLRRNHRSYDGVSEAPFECITSQRSVPSAFHHPDGNGGEMSFRDMHAHDA